ncbi:hypothetical protein BaRGS_00026682 [Batillaria attramentaria]|uniref:Uncharacterized protein n=1 Tax=Batillaria attramentaria TaxID=370345 RepID=A0ABD0K5H0_9CAEN
MNTGPNRPNSDSVICKANFIMRRQCPCRLMAVPIFSIHARNGFSAAKHVRKDVKVSSATWSRAARCANAMIAFLTTENEAVRVQCAH